MDLRPPPPLFHHHRHRLRYDNVLHPPDFIRPSYAHHRPLPPPPPPQTIPPHILLPPPLPPPPPPPPARHIAHLLPPRFTFSSPHHPVVEKSHFYGPEAPPKSFFDRTFRPPSPAPALRENIPVRIIHDYPERNPIFRDRIVHRGYVDNRIREFPENRDRILPLGVRELHCRVPDIDISERDRNRVTFYESSKLCIKSDDGERWDRGISNWGRDSFSRMDYDERRWDNGISDQGLVMYGERDYDDRRWDNGLISQDRELYCDEGVDVGRRWDSSSSNGVLFRLENKQTEFLENDLSQGRFKGRLWRGPSTGDISRSTKKSILQKNSILNKIQLGTVCSRRSGSLKHLRIPKKLSRGSFKSKQKEFRMLQPRKGDKREREQSPMELDISFKSNALVAKAILAPSHPDVKSDVKSMSLSKRSVNDVCGSSSKDLQDKAPVSGTGIVTVKYVSGLGESAPKNDAHVKAINLQGQSIVGCGISHSSQSGKKREARKQLTREPDLKMGKNGDDIMNAKDCTNGQISVSQINSYTTVPEGNLSSAFHGGNPCSLPSLQGMVSEKAVISGDSGRPFVPKMKRKRGSLTTSAPSCEADNVITECSGRAEIMETTTGDADYVLRLGDDDVACHAHEKSLANNNTCQSNSLGFIQHMNTVESFLYDRPSVLNAEKGSSESVDQYTRLGSHRSDDINEHPVLGGLLLSENSFAKWPSEVTSSIEGHDSDDSSTPQETMSSEFHEEKCFPKKHELISSQDSDCAVMQTSQDVTIFDVCSKDANSRDILQDQVDLPQVGVDAKGFKSLERGAVSDRSNVGLGISTNSGFLSQDHKATIPNFDVSSPVAFGTDPSHNIGAVEGSPEVISKGETCLSIDCSSKIIRKRKARGAQMGLSGTKTNVCVGTVTPIGGETTSSLEADLVPAVESDVLDEKYSSKEDGSLKQGTAGVKDFFLEIDFGANGSFPGLQKKLKLSSPIPSLKYISEDDTIADWHTTNPPIPDQQPTRKAELEAEQREDTSSASATINHCSTTDVEGKVDIDNSCIVNIDSNLDDGSILHGNGDLASITSNISLSADRNGDYASDSSDERLTSVFDMLPCLSSPEQLLSHSDLSFPGKTEASACLSENVMISGSDNISSKKPVSADPNICCPGKSIDAAVMNLQTSADITPSLLKDTSQVVKKLNPVYGKLTWSRKQPTSAVPKVIPGHHPSNISNARKLYPVHDTKSRTWHRIGNTSVSAAEPKSQPFPVPCSRAAKVARTTQSSYVRKGNSLVRNPSMSGVTPPGFHGSGGSVYRPTPCTNTVKSNQESNPKTGDADAPTLSRKEQMHTSEMTSLPILSHSRKSLISTPCNLGESSSVGNPPRNNSPCKTSDALEESSETSHVHECRTDTVINSDSQCSFEERNSEKKIVYVKKRSNQLVATSNSDMAILGADKNQASLFDGYYKSRQNQLVRTSSKNPVKREANGNAHMLVPQSILPKTTTRRKSGFDKTCRYSKVSFVWKLHDTESKEKDKNSLRPQKIWPPLFPSKRVASWRRFMLGTKSINSSFSTSSQKLLLSRRRGAIYTRSTHGFSLRMSRVFSVCGSSLKWSKSIEKNSKKANEEATRAVAAAQKRKKEQGTAPITSKSRNHVSRKLVTSVKLCPGERIFRIGSERYKMDTTRRTLHRITEKEPSSSALQSEKNVKKSYIPKRLLIGNEEYVRIGNGNQLVRDPKKRTRVLASEKVRWSLRTARLRLARKKKYCQFFTRFGKCNKDDGKCPYIHDPSKIVVCTKFLSGSCSNVDCKLTHKVIPERMQDCSYFMKGSCSNENCPYRHVNVGPDSTVCESFLRGYCADGNECRKKHTYVCPAFEVTGICPQASTCKLHHPKKKVEKKQPTSEQKIVRGGRYFNGGHIELDECSEATAEKLSSKGNVDIVVEGKYPEYISLDVGDDETADPTDDRQIADIDIDDDMELDIIL